MSEWKWAVFADWVSSIKGVWRYVGPVTKGLGFV